MSKPDFKMIFYKYPRGKCLTILLIFSIVQWIMFPFNTGQQEALSPLWPFPDKCIGFHSLSFCTNSRLHCTFLSLFFLCFILLHFSFLFAIYFILLPYMNLCKIPEIILRIWRNINNLNIKVWPDKVFAYFVSHNVVSLLGINSKMVLALRSLRNPTRLETRFY